MDLLKKIELLKNKITKLERLLEDLDDNIASKKKKISYLENEIKENVSKIDNIIKDYNANIKNRNTWLRN